MKATSHAVLVVSACKHGDDRVLAKPTATGLLLCVADGSGGITGGAIAAQAAVDYIANIENPERVDWVALLTRLDRLLESDRDAGETTLVVAAIREGRVTGASVGDSGAFLLSPLETIELTNQQVRKPLLGSGRGRPVAFETEASGRLLLATDGLLKYVQLARIRQLGLVFDLERTPAELVASARLPNGTLQDDVAIAVAG